MVKKIRALIDETIYNWIHTELGEESLCRYDLAEKYKEYGVNADELSKVIRSKYAVKSHKGWRLKPN